MKLDKDEVAHIWMRLEALAHTRVLPEFKNLHNAIRADLQEIDADLAPKKEDDDGA